MPSIFILNWIYYQTKKAIEIFVFASFMYFKSTTIANSAIFKNYTIYQYKIAQTNKKIRYSIERREYST